MLDKEICRKCYHLDKNRKSNLFNGRWVNGDVFCRGADNLYYSIMGSIPSGCPYYLEQLMVNEVKEKEDEQD